MRADTQATSDVVPVVAGSVRFVGECRLGVAEPAVMISVHGHFRVIGISSVTRRTVRMPMSDSAEI